MTKDNTAPDATPEKPWPAWAHRYLEALALVPVHGKAAEAAGIDRSTAYRLTQRDEAFALAAHDARDRALDRLEEVVYASGMHGFETVKTVTRTLRDGSVEVTETRERHRNPIEAMFYLKRWRPEFRESFRVEQTGADGGPVRHEVTMIDELVAEFRADLERLGR